MTNQKSTPLSLYMLCTVSGEITKASPLFTVHSSEPRLRLALPPTMYISSRFLCQFATIYMGTVLHILYFKGTQLIYIHIRSMMLKAYRVHSCLRACFGQLS